MRHMEELIDCEECGESISILPGSTGWEEMSLWFSMTHYVMNGVLIEVASVDFCSKKCLTAYQDKLTPAEEYGYERHT